MLLGEREQEQEGWGKLIPLKIYCSEVNVTFHWPEHSPYYMVKSKGYEAGVHRLPAGSTSKLHGRRGDAIPAEENGMMEGIIMRLIIVGKGTVTANYPFDVKLYIHLSSFILTENRRSLDERTD